MGSQEWAARATGGLWSQVGEGPGGLRLPSDCAWRLAAGRNSRAAQQGDKAASAGLWAVQGGEGSEAGSGSRASPHKGL